MLSIGAIKKSCSRKPAGLNQVFILIPSDRANIVRQLNIPVAEIQLLNGEQAQLIEFDKNSAFWEQEEKEGPGGDYHDNVISGTIRDLRLEVNLFIQLLQNRKVHVLFTTRKGNMYIMPFSKLLTKSTSGKKVSDKDFYTFSFSCQSEFPIAITNQNILPNSVEINISDFVFNTTSGKRYRLYVTSVGGLLTEETTDAATVNSVLITQTDQLGI